MSQRLLVELLPLLLALVASWFLPAVSGRYWAAPSGLLRILAGSGRRAIVCSAVITLMLCAALSLARPPHPAVHDEFAYLLGADTFAHGRLTNPTPALWQHFESYNILYEPTYQSKYPPGQSIALAAGQLLTGEPIAGVWLSMAAAAAAICWMLLAFVPARWALFGALLPAIRFGTLPMWDENFFAYWSTTFWGGGVALMGSAMMFGALPRLLRTPKVHDGLLLAAGLLVMLNSRPYETVVATVPAAVVMLHSLATQWTRWKKNLPAIAVSFAAVMICGVAAMAYLNHRITGHAAKTPYMLHVETYQVAPMFVFEKQLPDKTYRHPGFREYYYDYQVDAFEKRRAHLLLRSGELLESTYFFWGYVLLPSLLWLAARPRDPWILFGLVVVLSSLAAHAITTAPNLLPHYLAPAVPWIIFLTVAGLRRMRTWKPNSRRVGRAIAETAIFVCALAFLLSCARRVASPPTVRSVVQYRSEMLKQLKSTGERHLVLVRYEPGHSAFDEWVFNDADFDSAPVLWAHDMTVEENKRLLDRYTGRKVWSLYISKDPPRLDPYSPQGVSQNVLTPKP